MLKVEGSSVKASWEYLMPKKKERLAGYIRFSDPSVPLDDGVMESQARAIREYGEREDYIYDTSKHEYREAISAYTVPYMERKTLLAVLEAARRKEFDVLVVTEIRSVSRRTVEVFVIYDMLQKYGVRLETISERFEDSATGHLILSARAFSAEVERENTYARLQRGKKHRLENGNINGHNKAQYGYVFIDTATEVKAAYALNTAIVYQDKDGKEWTEPMIVEWITDRYLHGWAIVKIARTLTEWRVPSPGSKKKIHGQPVANVWHPQTIHDILTHRIYIGEVWANRFKRVENPKTGKGNMVERPQEEWILLEGLAPPILTREIFQAVQKQLEINKQEALRRTKADTPKEEIGLLRAGYAKCGICGRSMLVYRRGKVVKGHKQEPQYACCQRLGGDNTKKNHHTMVTMSVLDAAVREAIRDVVLDPLQVRASVDEQRAKPKPAIDEDAIQATIDKLQGEINNLFDLAKYASNDSTRQRLGKEMEALERNLREAEAMLIDVDEDKEDKALLETEIVKFEKWAEDVRPLLGDPEYLKKASYEELRLAVRIIGLTATVFPMHGNYPFRHQIKARPPEVMKMLETHTHIWNAPDSRANKNVDCIQFQHSIV